jgi:hypothetical protein
VRLTVTVGATTVVSPWVTALTSAGLGCASAFTTLGYPLWQHDLW